MTSTVTVSVRSLVVSVAAAAALLAGYFLGSASAGASSAVAAQGPTSTDTPSITMAGTGEATGIPDQLAFDLSVRTEAVDVSGALDSANRTTRAVLHAVRGQGISAKDIQTTGLSVRATYDYSGDGPPLLTGYAVSEDLSVLVRELPDGGATISAAVRAGGNAVRLHGVRLLIGDEQALLRQARAAAITDARAKAEQYAAASGGQLGDVLSVHEVHARNTPVYARTAGLLKAASESSVPIRAGSADLAVTVSVVWTLS